jgi:signal transduction histidine kinase
VTTGPGAEIPNAALLAAANRANLHSIVSRWLMHDLRGPAQALSLVLDLLEHGEPTGGPAVRQTLDGASSRLRHLLDLLDRTLRQPPAAPQPTRLVLHEITDYLAALQHCSRSPVTLDTGTVRAAQLPAVRGVEEHLTHALLNLLMNAEDALRERRGGTIRMTAATAADGRTVSLVVEDDGPGVPPEIQGRLFEPFVTTKRGAASAGLGLAVARQLVERGGGSVRYEAGATGAPGARFVVELMAWER